jgi:hypothetical protein
MAYHKSLPSVCVSVCVSPLSPPGNGSVYTSPRQRIHKTKNCWMHRVLFGPCRITGESISLSVLQGNGLVNTFSRQRRIAEGIVFYAVHVVSKESRQSGLPKTSSFTLIPTPRPPKWPLPFGFQKYCKHIVVLLVRIKTSTVNASPEDRRST